MGKTQLMLQYCYLHQSEYRFIIWMDMDDATVAPDSSRRLALNLGLDVDSSKNNAPEKPIKRVRKWLEQTTGCLILLGNADKDVLQYILRLGGEVILITPRQC